MCVCVWLCVCVRMCVWLCVCVCVCGMRTCEPRMSPATPDTPLLSWHKNCAAPWTAPICVNAANMEGATVSVRSVLRSSYSGSSVGECKDACLVCVC